VFISFVFAAAFSQAQLKTRNVVLIVSDGLRWQEVFTGADPDLLNEKHGGIWETPEQLRRKFWSDDPSERRKMLFPFLWGVVAKQGKIFGNQNQGSIYAAYAVFHGRFHSDPTTLCVGVCAGYNRLLVGFQIVEKRFLLHKTLLNLALNFTTAFVSN